MSIQGYTGASTWLVLVLRVACHTNVGPYEHSSILEASEQAFGTWPTMMPHVQTATAIGSLVPSCSISRGSVSPTKGVHTCLKI